MTQERIVDQIPSLRRYARALTGDAWAADDLVQDTLERACSKWRLWLVGSDLRAWLFTVMHHLFISQIRRAQRQGVHRHVDFDEVEHELTAPDAGREQALDLQRCLMLLPEDQRVVLLLVSVEALSYMEVAGILKVPVGTVMSRLSRARHRLQALMDLPCGPPSEHARTPEAHKAPRPPLRRLK